MRNRNYFPSCSTIENVKKETQMNSLTGLKIAFIQVPAHPTASSAAGAQRFSPLRQNVALHRSQEATLPTLASCTMFICLYSTHCLIFPPLSSKRSAMQSLAHHSTPSLTAGCSDALLSGMRNLCATEGWGVLLEATPVWRLVKAAQLLEPVATVFFRNSQKVGEE